MADLRGVALVLLILLSASAVGALAGFRMHLQQEWHENADPVLVNVTIDFPDGASLNGTVTVQGATANALGALEAAAAQHGIDVGVRSTSLGVYVHTIGSFRAEDSCGWFYSLGAKGTAWQPDQAADREQVGDGDAVFWYWGCL